MVWLEKLPDDWWKPYQSTSLPPSCIEELNVELLFLIRSLLLETRTYARVCKRARLLLTDFQNALDARHISRSTGSTKKIRQSEESISISSIIQRADQLPSNVSRIQLTMHWLAIDGEQPIIPENPLPSFKGEDSTNLKSQTADGRKMIPSQLAERSPLLKKLFELANTTKTEHYQTQRCIHPLTKNNLTVKPIHPRNIPTRRYHTNNTASVPVIPSSPSLAHELSIEQQLYFKSLTESCFNGTDKQRTDAFQCLASDAALQPLLPRLLLFISKGIESNIYFNDLNYILPFLSILKMLTMNTFISFDKYLHSVIPSLLTCLVCSFDLPKNNSSLSLFDRISSNNYSTVWSMREQASDLISYFEQKYSTSLTLTERIGSIIQSHLITSGTMTTYSILYACIRTLFLINLQMYSSSGVDILRNCKQTKLLEADFDLDPTEQQTLFDRKINELFVTYAIVADDGQKLPFS